MAKSEKGAAHLLHRLARRERGTAIQIQTRRVTLKDGTAAEASLVNLMDAEVPDRSYFGEACTARYENETVALAFAQVRLGKGLRSLLIISMTPPAAAQFLKSVEDMQSPSLEEIAALVHLPEEHLMEFPREEPEQTASLVANIVAVAVHGRETTMDFYHANAFNFIHARQSNQIYLEPVVRVNLRTSLMLSLMGRLKQLRNDFPRDAAALEEATP